MRIVLCSTFPPQRCGIASYTQHLATALTALGHQVIIAAERTTDSALVTREDPEVLRVWHRAGAWPSEILRAVQPLFPDVVHVQHTPAILGLGVETGEFCRLLKSAGTPSVVTLHTVHTAASAYLERLFSIRRCYESLGRYCDAVIVHQRETAQQTLERYGVPRDRIAVIPHGTEAIAVEPRNAARERLGLPGDIRLLLAFGFIHPQKNLHTVLRAMQWLPRSVPVRLLVVGSLQNPAWYNRAYLGALRRLVHRCDAEDRVELRDGFVSDADAASFLAASDLVLLPHSQGYGSASGVLHAALAAHRPVMVSQSPKFSDVARILGEEFVAPTHNAKGWARRIEAVLSDPAALEEAEVRLAAYAQATCWETVAESTLAVYERLLNTNAGIALGG